MKALIALPFPLKLIAAAVLLVVSMLFATGFGAADTSLKDVVDAMLGKEGGDYYTVLREIRFPRVVAAFFVGSALAVAGAIMQGMTRNPLADPGLLGLTSGANVALAVTLAFLPAASYFTIIVACLVGAGAGMFIVFGVASSSRDGLSPLKLILAGAAISLFLQALADGVGILFNVSKNISMWTSGGLVGITWQALSIAPLIFIGLAMGILFSRQLTVLSLNEELAVGLGQQTKRIRIILMILTVILAGSSVALAGNLAFFGLMIPHIVRMITGSDYRLIIPMAIVVGGLFMVLTDFAGRLINAPFETPAVALVALIGLPFFLFLVRKGGRSFV